MRATARGWAVASFLVVAAVVALATEPAGGSRPAAGTDTGKPTTDPIGRVRGAEPEGRGQEEHGRSREAGIGRPAGRRPRPPPPPPGPEPELAPARARWVLDRIEEEVAVIAGPGGVRVVPRETLDAGAREGVLLDETGKPDRAATARARARLAALRNRSFVPGDGDLRLDEPPRAAGDGDRRFVEFRRGRGADEGGRRLDEPSRPTRAGDGDSRRDEPPRRARAGDGDSRRDEPPRHPGAGKDDRAIGTGGGTAGRRAGR